MMKRIQTMLRDRRGFTLIELMVVVVIIGILAAIAVPQFTQQSEKARQGKGKADLKTIGTAIEMYYTENNGTKPDSLNALVGEGGYLRSYPYDPWGKDYGYGPNTPYEADGIYVPFSLYYSHGDTKVYYPPTE